MYENNSIMFLWFFLFFIVINRALPKTTLINNYKTQLNKKNLKYHKLYKISHILI